MKLRILLPLLAVASLSLGGLVGLAAFASPGAPIVSASPVEGDDAPAVAMAPVDAGPATGIGTSPVAPADPTIDPGGFWAQLRASYQNGGAISALVLVLYGAALAARRYVAVLRKGRAAAILAGALATLTAVATVVAAGQTPSLTLLVEALISGALLYLHPDPSQKVAPESLGGGK